MSANKKRNNLESSAPKGKKRSDVQIEEEGNNIDGLEFEDPFGDEFEEEIIEDAGDAEDDEDEENMIVEKEEEEEVEEGPKQVWRPGVDKLPEGEELDYDPSAYVMYHSFKTEWPCLSFDLIRDSYGDNRQRFPHSMFLVTGSQADRPENNKLTILQLSDLHKTYVSAESDEESDDENLDEDPTIEHVNVNHYGGVNRVRNMPQNPGVIASMSDTAQVNIYDLSNVVKSMMVPGPRATPINKPTYTFTGHKEEGFSLDWSLTSAGKLATGDCSGKVHVWNPNGASWSVDPTPYAGHKGSVEDIQWSPTEATVFATCSADKTVRIWDIRDKTKSQISVDAHTDDVNVISWNRNVSFLLASGSDDGSFKVWDLRTIKKASPLVNFTYHKGPITSLEWAPYDESMLAVSSADNQISVWDLSVEADETAPKDPSLEEFPPQLLFLHMGQYNIKELHFHPQITGTIVSTAEDSFNVFKPAITVSA